MNMLLKILIISLVFIRMLHAQEKQELSVYSGFEGGSVKVTSINQKTNTIKFKPGGDSIRGWPNWWYFRVDGIHPGENVKIILDNPSIGFWAKPDRASYSTDGKNWHHSVSGITDGESVIYNQVVNSPYVWFAWGPPFVVSTGKNLIDSIADSFAGAEAFTLAESLENQSIPALRVLGGEKPAGERQVIWIQARQHAWEAGASWVAQGLIEWIMSTDSSAIRLRESAEIVFIPVMEVDNVASGNGGKKQIPHDHNEDWTLNPVFPAVAAAQKLIKEYDRQGRFLLFIDLHNPGSAKSTYYYYVPINKMDKKTLTASRLFAELSQQHMPKALIPFDPKHRETDSIREKPMQKRGKNWVVENTRPGVVAVTFETAWNSPYSTITGYKSVGQQLGVTVAEFFEKSRNGVH